MFLREGEERKSINYKPLWILEFRSLNIVLCKLFYPKQTKRMLDFRRQSGRQALLQKYALALTDVVTFENCLRNALNLGKQQLTRVTTSGAILTVKKRHFRQQSSDKMNNQKLLEQILVKYWHIPGNPIHHILSKGILHPWDREKDACLECNQPGFYPQAWHRVSKTQPGVIPENWARHKPWTLLGGEGFLRLEL